MEKNPDEFSGNNSDTRSIRSHISNKSESYSIKPPIKAFIKLELKDEFKNIPKVYSELEYLFFHGEENEIEITDKYEWKVTSR